MKKSTNKIKNYIGKRIWGRQFIILDEVDNIIRRHKNKEECYQTEISKTLSGLRTYYDSSDVITLELLLDRLHYIEFKSIQYLNAYIGVLCGVFASTVWAFKDSIYSLIEQLNVPLKSMPVYSHIATYIVIIILVAIIGFAILHIMHLYFSTFIDDKTKSKYNLVFKQYEISLIKHQLEIRYGIRLSENLDSIYIGCRQNRSPI